MKLTKRSSFNMKLSYLGLLMFLAIGSAPPSYAIIYHFEEDFSDSQLSGWEFTQVDFGTAGYDVINTSTFVVENGALVSIGAPEPLKENAAFVSDTTAFGAWSLDIYLPSNLSLDEDHQIMMSKEKLGIETLYPIFGINIFLDKIELGGFNGTTSLLFTEIVDVSNMEYDVYQRYDLIRTTDRFYVFVDNQVALNQSFEWDLDTSINYFGLVASQGSNVRFDNLKITTDATGLLNEILNPTTASSLSETSSLTEVTDTISLATVSDTTESSSNSDTLFLTIGSGGIALTGGVFSWRRFQKKRIADLVKISSNGRFPGLSSTISQVFDNIKPLYFLLLGHKTKGTNLLDERFEADMKAEMQQFKHIFHPIRLAIMQLLHISSKSSSIEIRNRLDLSMSDYYNSVRQLEKMNFVKVFDDFDDEGLTKQFVIMEENGKRVYTKFIKLVGKYVDLAKDFIPDFDDDMLYPDS